MVRRRGETLARARLSSIRCGSSLAFGLAPPSVTGSLRPGAAVRPLARDRLGSGFSRFCGRNRGYRFDTHEVFPPRGSRSVGQRRLPRSRGRKKSAIRPFSQMMRARRSISSISAGKTPFSASENFSSPGLPADRRRPRPPGRQTPSPASRAPDAVPGLPADRRRPRPPGHQTPSPAYSSNVCQPPSNRGASMLA